MSLSYAIAANPYQSLLNLTALPNALLPEEASSLDFQYRWGLGELVLQRKRLVPLHGSHPDEGPMTGLERHQYFEWLTRFSLRQTKWADLFCDDEYLNAIEGGVPPHLFVPDHQRPAQPGDDRPTRPKFCTFLTKGHAMLDTQTNDQRTAVPALSLTNDDLAAINEALALLDAAYADYFARSDGYCKTGEGALSISTSSHFSRTNPDGDSAEPLVVEVFSSVFADQGRRQRFAGKTPAQDLLAWTRRVHAEQLAREYDQYGDPVHRDEHGQIIDPWAGL